MPALIRDFFQVFGLLGAKTFVFASPSGADGGSGDLFRT